jgi:hypothetical protein
MVYNIYIMSFIRTINKKLASGKVQPYYAEVENYWKDGKTKQRVIKYLGKYPYQTTYELTPSLAAKVARLLAQKDVSLQDMKERLEALGLPLPSGELKKAKIDFNPPHGKPVVHFYCE